MRTMTYAGNSFTGGLIALFPLQCVHREQDASRNENTFYLVRVNKTQTRIASNVDSNTSARLLASVFPSPRSQSLLLLLL